MRLALWVSNCLAAASALSSMVMCLPLVDLGIYSTLNQTKLIWTAVMAYFINGEVVSGYKFGIFFLMLACVVYIMLFDVKDE